ncbi:cyclin N-terminal domain-containing protein, partial [Favolaschia claudopus]
MFSSPASSSSDSEFSSSGSFLSAASSPDSSPASSTRSSPVHAASLVDPASHPRALMQLIDIKLDKHVIDYLVDAVAETVDFALGRTHTPHGHLAAASPISRGRSTQSPYLQKFSSFVSTVLSRAEVTPATVLVSLVYISRARPHLSIALEEWALERVFLGSLIVASKYTNDSTLKNVHWALCTGVFGKRDIGRIEREFLDVLDWDLSITETDVMAHHEGLIAAATRSTALASRLIKTAPTTMTTTTYLAPPAVRSRTHTRKHSAGAVVPELEPSSPLSSLASMSPRTPLSHGASSPPTPPHHKDVEMIDVPMDVSPVP